METDRSIGFECAACGAVLPAATVEYDDLGYPVCPECRARTGPLARLEVGDPTGVVN